MGDRLVGWICRKFISWAPVKNLIRECYLNGWRDCERAYGHEVTDMDLP